MFWMILLLILLLVFYIRETIIYKYWEKKNVYFEKPVPIFGNFFKVFLRQEQVGHVLKRIYDKLSDDVPYFGIFTFHRPVLVVKSKEFIKDVLIRDFSYFPNRTLYVNEEVDPLSANVLFSLRNEVWKTLRNKLSPIFTSGKLKMMLPLMKDVTNHLEELLEKVHDGEIDVRDLLNRYTVDNISTCAFGIDADSLRNENAEIKKMAQKLLNQSGFVRSFSVFCWFFCPIFVKIFRLSFVDRESGRLLMNVFKQSSEERKRKQIVRHDLIDLLNDIKAEEKETDLFKFDDLKLYAQALVFFNAGAEGTRTILTFCLYELAVNPDIQDKLRKEIRDHLDSEGSLSYETLFELEYLDLVLKETLRKYPFIPFLLRYAEKDHTFSTGLTIEQGTQVMVPLAAIHFDPKYYPNPDKFDPERFRGDKGRDLQYVFLPFGEGPRKCIGERFAVMAMKIGLAMFLKNFTVTPGGKTEIPMKLVKAAVFATPENGKVFLKVEKING